jgi:adenosylmethionine-8-amino-7-oxononanoate aminotransferase|tara:strand:- start:5954 stop:7078 length:1125 start_codon:yes stop_codon:yes gene_type:complete
MKEISSFTKMHSEGSIVDETYDYFVKLKNGEVITDTMSGLWCSPLGYSQQFLKDAAYQQSLKNPYYSNFLGTNNEITEQYAEALCNASNMDRVYFANSGSAAVETAIKISTHVTGIPVGIVSKHSYHGSTILSANASDQEINEWAKMNNPLDIHKFSNADELEELIERNIGFIIIEPVVAAGGVYAHSPKIFELLRIAQTKGIIVIFDETVTGFGKLGPLFAKDYFNFEPDIMILGKAISNGYFPLSACLIKNDISNRIKFFNHGFTFSGHPIGSAVGLAMLEHCKEGFDHSRLQLSIDDTTIVEHRQQGCMGAIEFERRTRSMKFVRVMRSKGYMLEDASENINSVVYCIPYIMSDIDYRAFLDTIKETLNEV